MIENSPRHLKCLSFGPWRNYKRLNRAKQVMVQQCESVPGGWMFLRRSHQETLAKREAVTGFD